ncbi:hypothetical protein RUM43_008559 [Polyplax serrata]|uniref:Uncharacterized protein n=1 Tax=Polyplax serrata TaxID=468196 RepID=A0AAN8NYP6_POLSC
MNRRSVGKDGGVKTLGPGRGGIARGGVVESDFFSPLRVFGVCFIDEKDSQFDTVEGQNCQ